MTVRLTPQDRRAIHDDPRAPRVIAEDLGISIYTITAIKEGRHKMADPPAAKPKPAKSDLYRSRHYMPDWSAL